MKSSITFNDFDLIKAFQSVSDSGIHTAILTKCERTHLHSLLNNSYIFLLFVIVAF